MKKIITIFIFIHSIQTPAMNFYQKLPHQQISDHFDIIDTQVMKKYLSNASELVLDGISSSIDENQIYYLLKSAKIFLAHYNRETRIFDNEENTKKFDDAVSLLGEFYKLARRRFPQYKVSFLCFANRLKDYAHSCTAPFFRHPSELIDYLYSDNGQAFYGRFNH